MTTVYIIKLSESAEFNLFFVQYLYLVIQNEIRS